MDRTIVEYVLTRTAQSFSRIGPSTAYVSIDNTVTCDRYLMFHLHHPFHTQFLATVNSYWCIRSPGKRFRPTSFAAGGQPLNTQHRWVALVLNLAEIFFFLVEGRVVFEFLGHSSWNCPHPRSRIWLSLKISQQSWPVSLSWMITKLLQMKPKSINLGRPSSKTIVVNLWRHRNPFCHILRSLPRVLLAVHRTLYRAEVIYCCGYGKLAPIYKAFEVSCLIHWSCSLPCQSSSVSILFLFCADSRWFSLGYSDQLVDDCSGRDGADIYFTGLLLR